MSGRGVLSTALKAALFAALLLLTVMVWANGSWDDRAVMVAGWSLAVGVRLGGWRPTRELVGKTLVVLGILLLALVMSVRFLLPAVVHEARTQVAEVSQQASDEFWSRLPSWAKR